MGEQWLDQINWNEAGLLPVIAQEVDSGEILMLAWMNRESLRLTLDSGKAVYWSRSRQRLWRKGEESGHEQRVREIRLDCDNDTLLLRVEQCGGIACHTGRKSCFYKQLKDGQWHEVEPILKSADDIYG
jgi:phosphoribosyl-AMP cyclohydrolase